MGLHHHAVEPIEVLSERQIHEQLRLSDSIEEDLGRIRDLVAAQGLTEDHEAWGRLVGNMHEAIVEENGFQIGWARALVMHVDGIRGNDPNSGF